MSSVLNIFSSKPREGLHPIPGTVPLTFEAALCPPLLYFVALLFLAPPPPHIVDSSAVKLLRTSLAILAAVLFFRLPLVYFVPQSIGLTYQLGLVGLYGGCRVLDAFFISPCLFNHIPRRVNFEHRPRKRTLGTDEDREKEWTDGGINDPFLGNAPAQNGEDSKSISPKVTKPHRASITTDSREPATEQAKTIIGQTMRGPDPQAVTEDATTENGWPHGFLDRASWAFELELSMRGVGFTTWTSADVRHTRKTWLPTVQNRLHSLLVHAAPVLLVSWVVIRSIYSRRLHNHVKTMGTSSSTGDLFDEALSVPEQLLLTAALGAFLMSAFSLGHSLFAILLSPLAPSPLAFFPPLYTTRIWKITSVRAFWSYGWHRLFARLFLVYGVWPGEWLERKVLRKAKHQPADAGKVLGAFASSAFVHSFAVRGVLGGEWKSATGEAKFFALNGLAVVVEEAFRRGVGAFRKRRGFSEKMWYDAWVGRIWWISVIFFSGRNFARGWVKAGLVREMAFM